MDTFTTYTPPRDEPLTPQDIVSLLTMYQAEARAYVEQLTGLRVDATFRLYGAGTDLLEAAAESGWQPTRSSDLGRKCGGVILLPGYCQKDA